MLPILSNVNQRNSVISNAISAIPYNSNMYTACISVIKHRETDRQTINCECFCSMCISVSPSFLSFPAVSDELCGHKTTLHTVCTTWPQNNNKNCVPYVATEHQYTLCSLYGHKTKVHTVCAMWPQNNSTYCVRYVATEHQFTLCE